MRRALFVSMAGLLFAFTFFYVVAWPSTVESGAPSVRAQPALTLTPDKQVWVALGPFHLVGKKRVTVNTVQLSAPSPGVEFIDARIDLGDLLLRDQSGSGTNSAGRAMPSDSALAALPAAAGLVLDSGASGTIYVAFSAREPGTYRFAGVELDYQAGWLSRRTVLGPPVIATIP